MSELNTNEQSDSQSKIESDSLVKPASLISAGVGVFGGGLAVLAAIVDAPVMAMVGVSVALIGVGYKIADVIVTAMRSHGS